MLLAHSLIMNRWLKPVWEDESLWRRLCPKASTGNGLNCILPWQKRRSKPTVETAVLFHCSPEGGIAGGWDGLGVMALVLSHHSNGFKELADMAGKSRSLCLIDWAMPERNLDYLCHVLPRALALLSGNQTRQRFQSFMGYGLEGFVERFHRQQTDFFLRYKIHKKYRAGSLIAVWYEVERR